MSAVNLLTVVPKVEVLRRQTQTSPHSFPTEPQRSGIPADDDALVLEALRIAGGELVRQSRDVERVWPGTELAERLALFAERMSDLRDRLDGREVTE